MSSEDPRQVDPRPTDPRSADARQSRLGSAPRKRGALLSRGPRYVREKLQGKVFLIPSCITVVGIFCGFLAIMSAVQGQPQNFIYAAKCIGLAIILDGLDGRVARSLNACSAFGREFDSLSDVICFGVAPAVLVYCWAFKLPADELGILVSFVFLVCSAARLARFNIITSDEPKSSFVGLPTPGAAAAMASIVYFTPEPVTHNAFAAVIFVYMLLIAFFMVSTLPFFSVKKIKLSPEHTGLLLVGLSVFVAVAWRYNQGVFLVGSTLYALSGPIQLLLQRRKAGQPLFGAAQSLSQPTEDKGI